MPLYEYQCQACGKRFELIRKFSDPPVEVCALCRQGPVERLFSSPAIQFKGSCWYVTDYAKKGEAGKTEGGKGASGTGGAAQETKSETAEKDGKKGDSASKTDAVKSDTSTKPADTSSPSTSGSKD